VLDALALLTKHPNLYISPDIYCHFPGGRTYVEAISMLPDQFIYASAYPLGSIKESVEMALKFPLPDDVMEKYMYGNAARLLKITAQMKKSQVA
jgi:predicted TIM-barrel fold metal-dependent hydrolase